MALDSLRSVNSVSSHALKMVSQSLVIKIMLETFSIVNVILPASIEEFNKQPPERDKYKNKYDKKNCVFHFYPPY